MPAVDPLSASARPYIPHDFTAVDRHVRNSTLQSIEPNSVTFSGSPNNSSPTGRVYKDRLPQAELHVPLWSHLRSPSAASIDRLDALSLESSPRRQVAEIGSDEWMGNEISRCLDAAKADLDIKGKGLDKLSTRIAELNDLVTLATSLSPFSSINKSATSPLTRRSPSHSPSFPSNETLSPGASPYSANSRPFVRHVSAPVSAHAFKRLDPSQMPSDRQPSRLRVQHTLLESPTLTETSEDGSEPAATTSRTFLGLGGPSLPPDFGSTLTPPNGAKRGFGRSKTGIGMRRAEPEKVEREVTVNAAQNLLTSLPSALFEIANLTSLTLRSNRLTALPAAIGELRNLRELNIAGNKITFLPSTILDLEHLAIFNVHPNPWLKPAGEIGPNGRRLGPLIQRTSSSVPKLSDLCINSLISPRPPSGQPVFLQIAWQHEADETHPLLDVDVLHTRLPHLSRSDLRRILQGTRSASNAAIRKSKTCHSTTTAMTLALESQFPSSHVTQAPDDAADNPYYYPCKSPRHRIYDTDATIEPPSRHLFLHAAEERVEWMTVFEREDLPVKWSGCSPGCLAFLEEEEEDECWGLSDDDSSAV